MKFACLFLLLIAAPAFAQEGYYPTSGAAGCRDGFKLQRYSAGRPGNMEARSSIPEDYGSPAGWVDIDTSKPHEGDYRCVKEDKPVVFDGHCDAVKQHITCFDNDGTVIVEFGGGQ